MLHLQAERSPFISPLMHRGRPQKKPVLSRESLKRVCFYFLGKVTYLHGVPATVNAAGLVVEEQTHSLQFKAASVVNPAGKR